MISGCYKATTRRPGTDWTPGFTRGCLLAILAGAFCASPLHAQISLSGVVNLAQRESSTVKLAEADLRKAQAVLLETKSVYIPNLVVGSSIGPPSIGIPSGQPSIANATMNSLAFSYPQRKYIAAAKAGIEAAKLNLKGAREQTALDASTAYIELDAVTHELEAAAQEAGYSDRLIQIEQQRAEAGVDPATDVLQARLMAAQLKLRMIHLRSRANSLVAQLATMTGLPRVSIVTEHSSIPAIPEVKADEVEISTPSNIVLAQAEARSKQLQARGDAMAAKPYPVIGFGAEYSRDSTLLVDYTAYYTHFKADNFSAGFSIQIPLFDRNKRAKAQESAADALRSTVEAEQAQRQNDVQIANLTGSLRETEAQAEIASLKQQIAVEQLKTVQTQLESGNGAGSEPGAQPQLSPKSEQQAGIDERQKFVDALDAGFDLSKVRLNLLHALGHIDEWLHELTPEDKQP